MFLDETQGVTDKMRAESGVEFAIEPKERTISQPPPQPAIREGPSSATLPTELEDQATKFFFTHFVIQNPLYHNQSSLFSHLSRKSSSSSSQSLYHSVLALGLAAMSRHLEASAQMPDLSSHAQSQYVAAISALHLALSSPDEATADSTLVAVMILTIFETLSLPPTQSPSLIDQSPPKTLSTWSNHVTGAAAILEARGPEQFETQDGLRLFVQAAVPLCVNCMQLGKPVPPIIRELIESAGACDLTAVQEVVEKPPWWCFGLLVRFSDFFGRVRHKHITALEEILELARTMDFEAEIMLDKLVSSEQRHIIYDVPGRTAHDDILPLGYCHVYPSFPTSELTNGVRSVRLLLNQMIRSVLLRGFLQRPPLFVEAEHTSLLHRATDTLRWISDDIIASVPQYLGYIGRDAGSPGSRGTSGRSPATELPKPNFLWSHFPVPPASQLGSLPLVRSAAGCHILWALFTVATTDVATETMQLWVAKRLGQIGSECGVRQAMVLAERVGGAAWEEGWWRAVSPRPPRSAEHATADPAGDALADEAARASWGVGSRI